MRASVVRILVLFSLVIGAAACSNKQAEPSQPPPPKPSTSPAPAPAGGEVTIDPMKLLTFPPLPKEAPAPPDNPTTQAKVDLGHRLFFEKKLSGSGKESCESCHELQNYGMDGLPVERAHATAGEFLRNTPTVYNAALNGTFGWDGTSTSLEDFLKKHLVAGTGMGASDKKLPAELKRVHGLAAEYAKAFGKGKDAVSADHTVQALAAYLRQLLTPAPWDRFRDGDKNAIPVEAKRGFNTFMSVGCATCHAGVNVGGSLVQKLGLVKPWPLPKGAEADQGRYDVTKDAGDKLFFRSAPLRNVAKTAPYLHNGSVQHLDEMVYLMADHQLGKTLKPDEIKDVVAFLDTLTGKLPPAALISAPASK